MDDRRGAGGNRDDNINNDNNISISSSNISSSGPGIVIVPETWMTPRHYEGMKLLLEVAGFQVRVVGLPSNGPSDAVRTDVNYLEKDTEAVIVAMREFTDNGRNVLMFMHGCGTISGCDAVARVVESSKNRVGHGRVLRLIMLTPQLLEEGSSFLEQWGDRWSGFVRLERGLTIHTEGEALLFNDAADEQTAYVETAASWMVPAAFSAWTSRTTHEGWRDYGIPCTYLSCKDDLQVEGELRSVYLSRLHTAGVEVEHIELNTGHCPNVTQASKVADIVRRAAAGR